MQISGTEVDLTELSEEDLTLVLEETGCELVKFDPENDILEVSGDTNGTFHHLIKGMIEYASHGVGSFWAPSRK